MERKEVREGPPPRESEAVEEEEERTEATLPSHERGALETLYVPRHARRPPPPPCEVGEEEGREEATPPRTLR